jgi:ATP-dependent DNA helicase DinG
VTAAASLLAQPIPTPDEYIGATFGHGGYLSVGKPNYAPREGQIALARAVDAAIATRTHLLSEAATGVGKSYGYAVPATYHAAMADKCVVIVTANISLQEQLVRKDLPTLAQILPWKFTYSMMKGRSNYLCRSQLVRLQLSGAAPKQENMFEGDRASRATADVERDRLLQWAEAQIGAGELGDVSSLSWQPSDKLWREFSTQSEDCKGSRCAFADSCGARRAQRQARRAKVVVTNYHLFFLNLLIYADCGVDKLLPPFDVAIFDEAHAAANVARDFFGWTLRESGPKRAAKYLRDRHPVEVEAVSRASRWFFEQMRALRNDRSRYVARVVPERLSKADREAAGNLFDSLSALVPLFQNDMEELSRLQASQDKIATCEKAWQKAVKVRDLVGKVLEPLEAADDNEVLFLEEDEFFRNVTLACRLVQPGKLLSTLLFDKTKNELAEDDFGDKTGEVEYGPAVSVICTSATLATDGDFAFARQELGAPRDCAELIVDTPFDYESQALFIIPERDLCEPNDPKFTDVVSQLFLRTIALARGRTLGLFTSRKRMNDVFDAVNGRTPFRILRQGDAPRTTLVEHFRKDTHSVLLGVASFWAGVDVPGESLSCVFIDKIPFPTPDDPVLDRLRETDKRAFGTYAVPRAVIEFKQGFGRLIRSTTDRGVVVCCDNRILTKGYGKQFLRSMPKMQKIRNLDAIREWIDGSAAEEVDPLS